MRVSPLLLTAAAASTLFACDKQADTLGSTPAQLEAATAGFVTARPAQARALLPQATLKPIITVGDPIPGQESNPDPEQRVWAPIPDGLGAYAEGANLILFANHEITSSGVDGKFPFARVSRLVLDPATLSVTGGSYAVTGKAAGFLFQRLCSASFGGSEVGLGSGWFLTGEESVTGGAEGIQLAVKHDGSETRKLPWLGRFAHENYIAVPNASGKVVLFGTDDNQPAASGTALRSELYMYVADNADALLAGTGKLYVFASDAVENSGYLTAGSPVSGRFVEVADAGSLSADGLQSAVDGLGAFKFVRLEDIDYARRPTARGTTTLYFVDTGNINARCGADPCDLFGSIYRLDIDSSDPTQNPRLTLLARSRGVAAGDWASPDNIAVSENSLMVQEDPAYAQFNRPERIWNFKFRSNGALGAPVAVVELETEKFTGNVCSDAAGTCWESSGIIGASQWLGQGTWLFDVQAHTLPFSYKDGETTVNITKEGGQLLYLRLPGS
ncbi:MAG TPA: alkaline phosphatase PhoX [Gemmatimonadales bacterium]|nr:alkaline phosphatase PhoX [Gemmatimonadales bacterium]